MSGVTCQVRSGIPGIMTIIEKKLVLKVEFYTDLSQFFNLLNLRVWGKLLTFKLCPGNDQALLETLVNTTNMHMGNYLKDGYVYT